jgi:DNA-binding LytR/AlgR family response regulator
MLHVVICDDTPDQLQGIVTAAERFFAAHPSCEYEIATFSSSVALLDSLDRTGECDIALLDICMPGILGTEAAREIRRRYSKTELIFLTTSDEYAVDAFALKAAHYLLKPFTQAQFDVAMERAMAHFAESAPKAIFIRAEGGELYSVDLLDLLYIESVGHNLNVHTTRQMLVESRRSLSRLLEELNALSPGQFVSPYKGYIVNHKAINSIKKDRIILKDQSVIPIPKRGYRAVQDAYFDYMFSGGGQK